VCSTLNRGAIPDLPADAVVQVSSYVGGAGAQPIAFGPMPTAARGYLQLMWNMQRLVEEAAVTGDYGALMEAVALNPQTPAGTTAQRVIDELLVAHKAFLPQFANKIAELEAAGITIKDDTVRDLCAQGL
jgi:6-phospho-beta-glucosidase